MLPTAYLPDSDRPLSRPVYVVLAIACAIMGAWASIITLRYFRHGAMILEADDASRVLALAAATMFVVAEMGAFGLFSLLPAQRMYDLRWKLITFVVAVLALEVVTVVAVQMAMTKNADMTQQTGAQRAQDLRRQIAQAEEAAAALRAQSGQLANAEHAWVKAGAPKLAALAASATAKTDGLYAELAKVDSTQHPTLIGLFGEDWAMAYAIARGILVSCAGLVFWGAVGALWRAFLSSAPHNSHPHDMPRPVPAPQPQPVPALAPAPTPAQPPAPAPVVPTVPGVPQPDGTLTLPAPTWGNGWKPWVMGGVVPLALATGAGSPTHAQAAPVPATIPTGEGVLKPVHLAGTPSTPDHAQPTEGEGVLKPVHPTGTPSTPDGAQPTEGEGVLKPVQHRGTAAGVKIDTGIGQRDGFRYRRVRAAIKAGKLRPSVRAIKATEGGSDETVRGYLSQMEREGLIERTPSGRGWKLKTQAS